MARTITKVKVWRSERVSTTYIFLEALKTNAVIPKESATIVHVPRGVIHMDDTVSMARKKISHFIEPLANFNDMYCWVYEKFSNDPSVMYSFINHVFAKDAFVNKSVIINQFWNKFGMDITDHLNDFGSNIDKKTATRVLFEVDLSKVKHVPTSIAFHYVRDGYVEFHGIDPRHAKDWTVGTLEMVPTSNLLLNSFDVSDDTIHVMQKEHVHVERRNIYFPFATSSGRLDKDDVKLLQNISTVEHELSSITLPKGESATYIKFIHLKGNSFKPGSKENLDMFFNMFETNAIVPFIKLKTSTNVYYKIHKGSLPSIPREMLEKWTQTPFVQDNKTNIIAKMRYNDHTFCTIIINADLSCHVKLNISIKERQTQKDVEAFIPIIDKFFGKFASVYDTAFIPRIPHDILQTSREGDIFTVVQIISTSHTNVTNMKVRTEMFKSLVQHKFYPYFGLIDNKDASILHLQYKKVNNYAKCNNIETFITLNRKLSHDEMIQQIVSTFLISTADAQKELAAWEATHSEDDQHKRPYFMFLNKDTMFVNIKIQMGKHVEFKYLVNGAQNTQVLDDIHVLIMKLLVLSANQKHTTKAKDKDNELFERVVHEEEVEMNTNVLEDNTENINFGDDIATTTFDADFLDEDLLAIEREFAMKEKMMSEEQNSESQPTTAATEPVDEDPFVEKGEVKIRGYLLNKLKEADRNLFNYQRPADVKRLDYPTLCGKAAMRQPVVVTEKEYKRIQTDFPDAVSGFVKSGSTPALEKRNHYICPKIWCPKSRVALSFEDYVKHGRKCPFDDIEEEPILFQSSIFGKGDTGLKTERHPGFLAPNIHPDRLCLPCCFKIEAKEGNRNKTRMEQCVPKFSSNSDAKEKNTVATANNERTDKNVIPEVRPEDGPIDKYILSENTSPLDENRFGLLPSQLSKFLNQEHLQGSHELGTGAMQAKTNALFRRGIRQSKNSFLDAIATVLDNEELLTSDQIVKAIGKHLDVMTFLTLENGRIMKMFVDSSKQIFDPVHFQEFYEWFKLQTKYVRVMNLSGLLVEMEQMLDHNKQLKFNKETLSHHHEILREYIIYQSFENFKNYIANNRLAKEHVVLLDLVANKLQHVINIHKYNIIVLEYVPEQDKLFVHCNVNSGSTYDSNYPYVLILKRNSYYEPIVHVVNTEGGSVEQTSLLYFNKSKPELKKMISFFTKNCKKTEVSYIRMVMTFLASQGYAVRYVVIDYGYNTCGFVVNKNLFIPLPVRFDFFYEPGIKYMYISDVPSLRCFLTQESIKQLFDKLNKHVGQDFYTITTSIVEKKRLVGLVIKGNDNAQHTFIPLNVRKEEKNVTLTFKNGLFLLIGYQDPDQRVERLTEYVQGWDKVKNIANHLKKIMEEDENLRNELQFIIDRNNPLPLVYKRTRLMQLVQPHLVDTTWEDVDNASMYKLLRYMEDSNKYDMYTLRSKRYNHTDDELFIDHFEVRSGKLEEAILLAENPFMALKEASTDLERSYVFGEVDNNNDMSDLLLTPDDHKDVPVKWRKLIPRFMIIDNTDAYTPDFMLDTMIRLAKTVPRSALTHPLYHATLQNMISKDYERHTLNDFMDNPWMKNFVKQKGGAKDFDTIMEGLSSIHYYPSIYDLTLMSKLAHINVVLIGRKTEKNPDGFEVIYQGSSYFTIWLYAYDRFKIIDRFSLIANVKDQKVMFTQQELPFAFIEKIKNKLILHNVEVDDS